MTLHDIYATLLRRGMPEHARLGHDDTMAFSLRAKVKCSDCAKTEGVALLFDRDDAADLLTMHAMRWFNGPAMRLGYGAASAGETTAILNFIVNGTEHLEPK